MKRTNLLPLIILGLLFTSACGPAAEPTEDHSQHAEASGIQLNNGQKWTANPETTTGIANMTRLMENFDQQTAGTEEYQELGKQLQAEFGEIFRKCTMTGEAHEQLHHFLLPMVEPMKTLQAGEGESLADVYQQLQDHLTTYSNYFQ